MHAWLVYGLSIFFSMVQMKLYIHDTEFLAQCDDKTAWLDLSHQENFIVVFGRQPEVLLATRLQ